MEKELDKSALLSQLKIDHNEPEKSGISAVQLIVACLISASIGAGALYYLNPSQPIPSNQEAASNRPITSKSVESKQENASTTAAKKIELPNADEVLNASGYITPRRITTVSAEVMGLITEVLVEEGMEVKKGQVLAEIDKSTAKVSVELAEAQLEASNIRLDSLSADIAEAKRVLKRVSELKGGNYSSEAQRTRAETDLAKFKSAFASAKADIKIQSLRVNQAREHFDNHTIRAPFDGVVTIKAAQPGILVAPNGFSGTGICTVVDMDSLEIEVDVNESFIGRVFPGQRVVANLDAYPDWDIPATVIATIPTADRAKATVSVRIQIEQKDARILPDMGVKVAFFKAEEAS